MADTVTEKQDITTVSEKETQEVRTFTQEEVNKIVENRVAKERAKANAEYEELRQKASKFDEIEEANKSELQKATERADSLQKQLDDLNKANKIRSIREKVSTETGVPVHLLNGETEEECKNLADGINAFISGSAKPNVAPVVKDGGEIRTPTLTKAEILGIKDEKARIKAIEENIALFN